MKKCWYPKTLGRAARYLRRNRKRFSYDEARASDAYYRQLVCQIKLSAALERGIEHHYNIDSGQWRKE